MTILQGLSSYDFRELWMVHALGWTLLHFCWQGALVALILWCVLGLLRGQSSQLRYAAACAALALMVALPLVTFAHLAPATRQASAQRTVLRLEMDTTVTADGSGAITQPLKDRAARALDAAAPWIPALWLTGVILFLARLSFGLVVARRMKSDETQTPPPELQQMFHRLRVRLGMTRAVELLHSAAVQVPTVIGWLRPVVLIPVSCLTGLSAMQIEAVLCHELAHIQRNDYLVNVFQSLVEALLFYHPGIWWVSRQIRRERECCCDELAVAIGGDVLAYARALSYLEERRSFSTAIVLGANGGVLKMRIKRLLGSRDGVGASQLSAILLLTIVTAGIAMYVGGVAHAQPKLLIKAHPPIALIAAQIVAAERIPQQAGQAAGGASETTMTRVYQTWVDQDVHWVISDEERAAFLKLTNDLERENFIENFWERHNPPGAAPNTFKAEHYRRMAYSNEHFATDNKAGWATDRGHIYILYGPPDDEDEHPTGGSEAQYRYEVWHYRFLPGIGDNVDLNFVDTSGRGDYHYTVDHLQPGSAKGIPNMAIVTTAAARIMSPPQGNAAPVTGTGAIEGTVVDPTGALVPHATLTATNTDTGVQAYWETDNTGKFLFSALPAGVYNVEVVAKGFQRMLQENVRIFAGQRVGLNMKLTVNGASQSLTVIGKQSAALIEPQAVDGPMQVSSGTMAQQLIFHPVPVYPAIATAAHVQGVVVLHAIVSKTGTVVDLKVVSGPPMLLASALDAVRQWTYKPYLLNGEPTAVATTINVNYSYGGDGGAPAPLQPSSTGSYRAAAGQRSLDGQMRVSTGVAAALIISQKAPTYPVDAKAAHIQGVVKLSALISKTGEIEDLKILSGPKELVQSTLDAVSQWKYKPYLLNGEPTAVATAIDVHYSLEESGPAATQTEAHGETSSYAGLRKIGDGVSPPELIYRVDPQLTYEDRKAGTSDVVTVNLVVDAQGNPQNVHVVRSVNDEFDAKAVEAIRKYRFKPAMEAGKPVPVELNIQVAFQFSRRATFTAPS